MSAAENIKHQTTAGQIYEYPGKAWKLVIHHGGNVKLKKLDVLSDDVGCSTALLISSELVVDFDNISEFVGQVILEHTQFIVHSLIYVFGTTVQHK